jgi:hypothetical protein
MAIIYGQQADTNSKIISHTLPMMDLTTEQLLRSGK